MGLLMIVVVLDSITKGTFLFPPFSHGSSLHPHSFSESFLQINGICMVRVNAATCMHTHIYTCMLALRLDHVLV